MSGSAGPMPAAVYNYLNTGNGILTEAGTAAQLMLTFPQAGAIAADNSETAGIGTCMVGDAINMLNSIVPNASGNYSGPYEVKVFDQKFEAIMTNTSNASALIDVYTCYVRKDFTPAQFATIAGFTSSSLVENASWQAYNAVAQSSDYGVTPFNMPLFCHWIKVLKVHKLHINPGKDHTLRLSRKKPWILKGLDWNVDNSGTVDYTNWTGRKGGIFHLLVVKPTPEMFTGHLAASAEPYIAFQTKLTAKYCFSEPLQPGYLIGGGLTAHVPVDIMAPYGTAPVGYSSGAL